MSSSVCCLSRASALVSMLRHSAAPTEAYPTMAAVEALAAVVCEPGARTTDPILRHALLSETGALGRPLFALFNHPASALLPLFCIALDMIKSLLVAYLCEEYCLLRMLSGLRVCCLRVRYHSASTYTLKLQAAVRDSKTELCRTVTFLQRSQRHPGPPDITDQ